ncbi:glycosyltransferase family 4 protein [Granulicella sibirica]|uniref:Glycosyl transferase, group 1 family protein n=1 Tax=Granulicella sibirica TaxID=2479048 RepID=A0A4Q0SYU2_9BACT|nr:glycosyltransferase family 4 protein [Granulicella sibirica]RXH56007.1 glycosyl transferase, group 1 family protein [Granulicella sibirica]
MRLAYLVSHPIQYQAPLLRRIAQEPDIDLTVFFGSGFSVRNYQDEGFGVDIQWDIPLLEGYRYEFLPSIHDTGRPTVFSPLSYGLFTRLRRGNFDVLWVHGYATANALHGMIAARALGIPVLLRAESWLRDRTRSRWKLAAKRGFFALLRPFVSGVMPIGSLNDAYWSRYLGDEIPRIRMPYAVDNRFFQERSAAASLRRSDLQAELGLDPKRPVILFASKLQERKNCADLIAAYARLQALAPLPYLVIVGDGEQRLTLEKQAQSTGSDSIRFCGFRNQSELPRFFDLASVFVLPSRHEPWGLIVNEVMNAGRAVVLSSDAGCQPDLVTDGVEGCVFPAGDVDALVNALLRVLAVPGAVARMGENARARIDKWSFEEDVLGLRKAIAHITHKSTHP